MIIPRNDPNEAYEIRPVTKGFGFEYGWSVVTCNGRAVRYYWPSNRHLAERYISDPDYRLSTVDVKHWRKEVSQGKAAPARFAADRPYASPKAAGHRL